MRLSFGCNARAGDVFCFCLVEITCQNLLLFNFMTCEEPKYQVGR